MNFSSTTLKELIKLGVNIIIGGGFPASSLKEFASLAVEYNTNLTVVATHYSVATLKEVARIAGKNITLDFS